MTEPSGRLTDIEEAALHEALDDEYEAVATYDQVIADFGLIRPFSNIAESERRHIQALATCFERYDVEMPANPWTDRAPRFETPHGACTAAIEGEIRNVAMYDRLLASTNRPDIIHVYENLQRASQDNHLAAFRRCVARNQR